MSNTNFSERRFKLLWKRYSISQEGVLKFLITRLMHLKLTKSCKKPVNYLQTGPYSSKWSKLILNISKIPLKSTMNLWVPISCQARSIWLPFLFWWNSKHIFSQEFILVFLFWYKNFWETKRNLRRTLKLSIRLSWLIIYSMRLFMIRLRVPPS